MTQQDIETAERLGRRRARMLPILALVFISQQASFFVGRIEDGARTVDQVKIAAWLVLSIVLLALIASRGFWFRSKAVRGLIDDDVTRANRASALGIGFLASLAGAIATYVLTMVETVTAREAVHIVMTLGIGAALLRFGYLERRAHRDG
jgi:hypothetical protein